MKKSLHLTLVACVASAFSALAQMGGPPTTGFNASLTKLFGSATNFSARCGVRVLDLNQKEKMALPMDFALRDGRMRAEVDMTKIKGQGLSPEQAAQFKQLGMERVISLTQPEKKSVCVMLPAVQACVTQPLSKEDADAIGQDPKMEKTVLGKETLDGHPCEKSQVALEVNGKKTEVTVWAATDLNNFPIQIQSTEKGDTVILRFQNIQFTKPDAKLFEVPAGYTTYASMEAFMMGMMQKMMNGAAKP
jgi:hypothetical protein